MTPISKLATHPPQHADAPSLQLAAVVLSPFPSHRRGHESAAAFSRSAPRRGAPRQAVRRPAAARHLLIRTIALLVQACQYHIVRADPWCLGRMLRAAAMVVSDELPKASRTGGYTQNGTFSEFCILSRHLDRFCSSKRPRGPRGPPELPNDKKTAAPRLLDRLLFRYPPPQIRLKWDVLSVTFNGKFQR